MTMTFRAPRPEGTIAAANGCNPQCPLMVGQPHPTACNRRRMMMCRSHVGQILHANLMADTPPAERFFKIALQPITRLNDGVVLGYEALARFTATRHPVPFWLNVARRFGLTVELDLALISAALELIGRLPPSAYLALNVSPVTILDPRLAGLLAPVAGRIVLELTEHTPVTDYADLRAALAPLRALGLRLAIDDMGAGFANFRHVLELSPDIIKIDNAFIHDLPNMHSNQVLVVSLVSLARGLGATLVAEGIETDAERALLMSLSVENGQGYLLGRPSLALAA